MNKTVCRILAGLTLALALAGLASTAEARAPCPPGYHWEGPRGCMPNGPYAAPPPPPAYYYPAPCPPGTVWSYGACRPVVPPPPPPPPGIGIYIPAPPVFIGP